MMEAHCGKHVLGVSASFLAKHRAQVDKAEAHSRVVVRRMLFAGWVSLLSRALISWGASPTGNLAR